MQGFALSISPLSFHPVLYSGQLPCEAEKNLPWKVYCVVGMAPLDDGGSTG